MNRREFVSGWAGALVKPDFPAARHRIASVKWHVYKTGRIRRNYWRALRLKTDQGAEGAWGVKPRPGSLPVLQYASARNGTENTVDLDMAVAQERTASLLIGRPAGEIEGNWNRLYENRVPVEIVTMADIALWDLAAHSSGQPVYRLAGQERERIKVYVSSMPNLPDAAAWAKHAAACKRRGYGAYKIHPYIRFDPVRKVQIDEFRGFPEQDLEICRAVREAVGPDFPLMFDNAWTYTLEQAIRVGRVLDELWFTWFESPLPETEANLDAYVKLAKTIRTPVCAPQADDTAHIGRLRWIERGACRVCRGDANPPGGGITSNLILAKACARRSLRMDLHAWGQSIYTQHAIAAMPERVEPYQELYDADPAKSMAEAGKLVERSTPAMAFSVYNPDAKGFVRLTEAPGIGIRVNWKFVEEHAV